MEMKGKQYSVNGYYMGWQRNIEDVYKHSNKKNIGKQ